MLHFYIIKQNHVIKKNGLRLLNNLGIWRHDLDTYLVLKLMRMTVIPLHNFEYLSKKLQLETFYR